MWHSPIITYGCDNLTLRGGNGNNSHFTAQAFRTILSEICRGVCIAPQATFCSWLAGYFVGAPRAARPFVRGSPPIYAVSRRSAAGDFPPFCCRLSTGLPLPTPPRRHAVSTLRGTHWRILWHQQKCTNGATDLCLYVGVWT